MMPRTLFHPIRNAVVRLGAERPFRPIEQPRKRIVLIRPDHFGDMLMLAPALNAVRSHVRDHELILMTGPWNRTVAEHLALVDSVVTYPFPGFERDGDSSGSLDPYRKIGEAARLLREIGPEAAVLLRDDHWWGAWMAREAGVALRFGYAGGLSPFLTHPVNVGEAHYVQQNAHLISTTLRVLGYTNIGDGAVSLEMTWPESPEHAREARDLLEAAGIEGSYVIVHPGTGAPVKRWPVERWGATIELISSATGLQTVLTGAPDERELCDDVTRHAGNQVVNLAGSTSLFTLAEVIRGARLAMGVDSGPLHLATAVATPSVHLYGPSDPVRYGPWGDRRKHRALSAGMTCPACGDISPERPEGCGCMMAISPSTVARIALEMLDHAP